jgi:hypothetical protein
MIEKIEVQNLDQQVKFPAEQQSSSDAMLSMIERLASKPEVNIENMERFVELRNAELARMAANSYTLAFSKMQEKMPIIKKSGKVSYKDKESKESKKAFNHAKLEDVMEAINPILSEFEFSLQHTSRIGEDRVPIIRTTLKHKDGHSEFTERTALADSSGGKNNIQAWGSTTSYLKRYNIFDLLGLAARDEDDDGVGSQEEEIATIAQRDSVAKYYRKLSDENKAIFDKQFGGVATLKKRTVDFAIVKAKTLFNKQDKKEC